MGETKVKKINLSTAICIFIIIILITALMGMYFYYNNKIANNKKIAGEKVNPENNINKSNLSFSEEEVLEVFDNYCNVFLGNPGRTADILVKMNLISQEELENIIEKEIDNGHIGNTSSEYFDTGIKYSEFMTAILSYMTEECYYKNFGAYSGYSINLFIRNTENDNLMCIFDGGSGCSYGADKVEKLNENSYKGYATWAGPGEEGKTTCIFKIENLNGKCVISDFEFEQ